LSGWAGGIGGLLPTRQSGANFLALQDGMGSVAGMLSSSGSGVAACDYSGFGKWFGLAANAMVVFSFAHDQFSRYRKAQERLKSNGTAKGGSGEGDLASSEAKRGIGGFLRGLGKFSVGLVGKVWNAPNTAIEEP